MLTVKYKALKRLVRAKKKKVDVIDDGITIDLGHEEVKLIKGSQAEIPIWLTEILEQEGYVSPSPISIEEISKYLYQEKQNSTVPGSLVQLPWDFYMRAKATLSELTKGKSIQEVERLNKISYMINEVVRIRLRKIIQLASLNVGDQTILSKLTPEENLIFLELKKNLEIINGDIGGNTIG
ncbi:DNA replication complex GINS family protein [Metallosphaera tengchongensis]|uniref:DNA replication complex GINS family protein n=1 Tax=Metallosphaera tengchongensis TaxID=1532350 RepID=A0A6N0NV55_9CREN|nr:DNA replication complex GINS family protein [Metallosphaera tengchongensis]QKQ99588.1 DNA replication complex GINS family protein [Metallosphaera tengchongensis]